MNLDYTILKLIRSFFIVVEQVINIFLDADYFFNFQHFTKIFYIILFYIATNFNWVVPSVNDVANDTIKPIQTLYRLLDYILRVF